MSSCPRWELGVTRCCVVVHDLRRACVLIAVFHLLGLLVLLACLCHFGHEIEYLLAFEFPVFVLYLLLLFGAIKKNQGTLKAWLVVYLPFLMLGVGVCTYPVHYCVYRIAFSEEDSWGNANTCLYSLLVLAPTAMVLTIEIYIYVVVLSYFRELRSREFLIPPVAMAATTSCLEEST